MLKIRVSVIVSWFLLSNSVSFLRVFCLCAKISSNRSERIFNPTGLHLCQFLLQNCSDIHVAHRMVCIKNYSGIHVAHRMVCIKNYSGINVAHRMVCIKNCSGINVACRMVY